jgi:hypothetical protein
MFVLSFLLRSKKDASSLLRTKIFLFLMHQEFIFKANVLCVFKQRNFPINFPYPKRKMFAVQQRILFTLTKVFLLELN